MAALLLLPVVQVGCVRFIDPPMTMPMLLRPLEQRAGKVASARQYSWLSLREMPRDFVKFVIVAEDQRFFSHRGFDWEEIDAARKQAARSGKAPRGASTITMQCARSLFLWQGRSWVRKGLESYYTLWMETLLPKRRILELYVNVVELGDGIYGLRAAARAHYAVEPQALSRSQCAMLAAMLPAPRSWYPRRPSPRLAARHARILRDERQFPFQWPMP
jgi:monofunctional biosynthetic peptidoglycan transglycosylase